jgi:hypothetical protein
VSQRKTAGVTPALQNPHHEAAFGRIRFQAATAVRNPA